MFVFVLLFFFFTLTTSRWNRVIVCLNYFFEKLSGPVAMINGLWGVKVLRGGILVILFDSCVVEGKLITFEHAWACQKFHACELVKNSTSVD